VLRSRRSRAIGAVSLLVGGVSLAAVSAGAAVLDGEEPAADASGARSGSRSDATASEPVFPDPAPRAGSRSAVGELSGSAGRSTSGAAEQSGTAAAVEPVYPAHDGERIDAERIRDFLADRDSPLAAHAGTFVAAGIAHDVDPRVVVGIAIAESNGGERLPADSHNAWGWSGDGPHGLAAWGSWEESIHDYTELLGARYDTDDLSVDFAQTYCPPNWRWWHDTVTWAVAQI
jgi:flagellum-specific peptidoglycan hydrolase FlgJ